MKAVLISIKPKWCELIASGEKTVEVRKTRPKLKTPFKCYIYCTKDPKIQFWKSKFYSYADDRSHNLFDKSCNGKVIGEFVCDEMQTYFYDTDCGEWAEPNAWLYYIKTEEGERTCMEYDEFAAYGNGKTLYGWHISKLVIYDKPKELSELIPNCQYGQDGECTGVSEFYCPFQKRDYNPDGSINLVECGKKITRPPQSWCYVEDLDGDKEC